MSNLVRLTIRDQPRDLQVKEWQGQRVVTFREIDELHERPAGTAARNFSQHRHRFIEGVDFFRLSYAEANSTNFVELASPNGLTLITESGYLMLVKSFTDDLAWEVQRQLINGYFRAKAAAQFYIPKTYAEALRLATGLGMTWLQKRWDADHPPSDPPRRRRQLSVVQ